MPGEAGNAIQWLAEEDICLLPLGQDLLYKAYVGNYWPNAGSIYMRIGLNEDLKHELTEVVLRSDGRNLTLNLLNRCVA